MRDHILLETEGFRLSLDFQVFESDVSYPSNTILSVCVLSEGFSASTTLDIDMKHISTFCDQLQKIYESLNGEAKIQEPYGNRQYISFSRDKMGHILVSGLLNSNGANGFWQELKFENSIDQTFLPRFLKNLTDLSQKCIE